MSIQEGGAGDPVPQVIPDNAVDAAFREMSKPEFRSFRDEIRAGLEAAAPYLLAAAWDEGFGRGEVYERCIAESYHASLEPPARPLNPYRKAE